MFKGWKTLAFGLLLAAGVPALDYLAGVDFAALGLDPKWSAAIGVAIMVLRAMTSTPLGRKLAIGALMAGALSLSACGPADIGRGKIALGLAGAATPIVLSADEVARIELGCRGALPALAIAAAPGMPAPLRETAVYPQAYCAELLQGRLPPTTDANTPSWLPDTLSMLAIAAKAAGVILPLLL